MQGRLSRLIWIETILPRYTDWIGLMGFVVVPDGKPV
jgi:hypothetical protein